jgi:hypothetical protein
LLAIKKICSACFYIKLAFILFVAPFGVYTLCKLQSCFVFILITRYNSSKNRCKFIGIKSQQLSQSILIRLALYFCPGWLTANKNAESNV